MTTDPILAEIHRQRAEEMARYGFEDAKDSGFYMSPTEEAALLEALEQADRGEVISGEELLRDLRREVAQR